MGVNLILQSETKSCNNSSKYKTATMTKCTSTGTITLRISNILGLIDTIHQWLITVYIINISGVNGY